MAYWTDLKTFWATTYVDVAFAYLFLSFKYFISFCYESCQGLCGYLASPNKKCHKTIG